MLKPFLAAVALFGVRIIAAGVSGAAFGFANGTTGGGDAEALAPSDFSQLAAWLTDNTPRIILIDKEFDYLASEGECTDYKRRIPDSNTCGSAGQNAIDIEKLGWCDPYPSITCTYYKVPLDANDVTSNKSIVGVGIAGVIRERVGAWSMVLATLLVIQKIHITDLNPQDIWGGDTISLDGTDNVWIDHVEILLVGRQIFVSGRDPSGHVTTSNTEFDGRTNWFASCDGHHYWSILGLGKDGQHAFKNYWFDNTGHAFEVGPDANAFIEGNVFEQVETRAQSDSVKTFAVSESNESACKSELGRACVPNDLVSGTLSGSYEAVLSSWPSGENDISVMEVNKVRDFFLTNAGSGKIWKS